MYGEGWNQGRMIESIGILSYRRQANIHKWKKGEMMKLDIREKRGEEDEPLTNPISSKLIVCRRKICLKKIKIGNLKLYWKKKRNTRVIPVFWKISKYLVKS